MSDIFGYLRIYGKVPLEKMKFNKIDALILSQLSYLDLRGIVPKSTGYFITIKKAYALYSRTRKSRTVIWKNDTRLFNALASCVRYKNLKLSGFADETAEDEMKQFCALTITLSEKLKFISFRGTDHSVTGWKEDFSLYSMRALPSQLCALKYFSSSSQNGIQYILGGHSKGGNHALYTAQYCGSDLKKRIKEVYNFDGPSLNRPLNSEKYRVFIPSASVFGMMLRKDENYSVIKSRAKGFFQHDITTWEINDRDFIYLNRRTLSSEYIENALILFTGSLSEGEKTEFIRSLFKMFYKTGMDNFDDIFRKPHSVICSFIKLKKPERAAILCALGKAVKCAGFASGKITQKRVFRYSPLISAKQKT